MFGARPNPLAGSGRAMTPWPGQVLRCMLILYEYRARLWPLLGRSSLRFAPLYGAQKVVDTLQENLVTRDYFRYCLFL